MAFMVLTVFTSCQKDEALVARFDATMEGFTCDGKTVLNGDYLYWVPGDQIEIFGTNSNYGTYEYETAVSGNVIPFNCVYGNAGEATYRAIYPASYADVQGRLVMPEIQKTPDGSLTGYPMYAESNTTFLDFKNLGGVLKLSLQCEGITISSIQVTSDHKLSGTYTIDYNNGDPILREVNGTGTNSVILSCTEPQDISSAKSFYISLPVFNYRFLQLKFFATNGHVCTKTMYNGNLNLSRSSIITITLAGSTQLDFTPEAGVLPGLFSIAPGTQVHFSSGNMQYTTEGTHAVVGGTSEGTWRFAPNQYDYVGTGNTNIGSTYKGWIDLFGWGTSGWNSGVNNNNGYKYMPYSYGGMTGSIYGPGEHDLTGNYSNADWAVYNAISNGGNQPRKWRCLTKDEWMYLTTGRANYDTKRGSGTVNGVGGQIFLPDNWQQPDGCPVFNPSYADAVNEWGPNTYTAAQWARMEANGAIFLPASGRRAGNAVTYVGLRGGYWSTTASGDANAVGPYIWSVAPGTPGTESDYDYYFVRTVGLSVRPIKINE